MAASLTSPTAPYSLPTAGLELVEAGWLGVERMVVELALENSGARGTCSAPAEQPVSSVALVIRIKTVLCILE